MLKLVLIFISFLLIQPAIGQDCFQLFSLIKRNPKDNISLAEVLENCHENNVIDQMILFKSLMTYDPVSVAKEYILIFTELDIDDEDLNSWISDSLWQVLKTDSLFVRKLDLAQENSKEFYEKDTVCNIINKAYDLDQSIRKFEKLSKTFGTISIIDSIVAQQIWQLLLGDKISTKKLGLKNEKKLYICLLHDMRYLDDHEFEKWDTKLKDLVVNGLFNPYSFANIVDERLRYINHKDYPKYNFLRSIEVSKEKEIEIEKERRKINAY